MAATFSSRATNAIRSNNLGNDPGGFRTHDLRIKSPLLYQLSYRVLMAFKIQRTVHRVSRSRAARPMVWEGLLMVRFPMSGRHRDNITNLC